MPNQDTTQTKEKIISILKFKGPSLPVHIAKEINQSILFTGAFLSELVSEKRIKTSYMKVGSSPLYLIPGQENKIENFAQHLKSKEKDAFLLIKEKKFLKDSNQDPAIRVALRAIKDFAIPFESENQIFWRFIATPESEFKKQEQPKQEDFIKQTNPESMVPQATKLIMEKNKQKEIDIFDKPKQKTKSKKITKKKSNTNSKQDKFFNMVKEYLNEKDIEITDIIGFSKSDLTLKIKKDKELILIAFNKKKIDEKDILNAYKKSSEHNLPYAILTLGEQTKKIINIIDAIKSLESLEKIE